MRPTEEQIEEAKAEVARQHGPEVAAAFQYDGSLPCGNCDHRADEHTWGRADNPCELTGCDCKAFRLA